MLNRSTNCFGLIIAGAAFLLPALDAHAVVPGPVKFTVMSRNVYVGADLTQLFNGSPFDIPQNMAKVFKRVKKTDFNERAAALADEIQANKPLLVGLQEVALWRTQTPADGPLTDAQDVAFDFLQILTDELASRGLHYQVLSVFNGFDLEIPATFSSGLKDVRFTDRDAILGRVTGHFSYSNIQKHEFSAQVSVSTGFFGDVNYPRAWESVDVKSMDTNKKFRFVNTHLEVLSPFVNQDQADELLNDPLDTNLPVVLAGDLNAAPNDPFTDTYELLTDANLHDAWHEEHPGSAGFTCCQDAKLLNVESQLSHRIDYVFFGGAISIRAAKLVGQDQTDRTPSGLWPSDHAGIVAKLTLD